RRTLTRPGGRRKGKAMKYRRIAPVVLAIAVVAAVAIQGPVAQAQFPAAGGWVLFTCRVSGATAATQCQAAPAAGLRNYVSDVTISNNVGTVQTVKLVTGTG